MGEASAMELWLLLSSARGGVGGTEPQHETPRLLTQGVGGGGSVPPALLPAALQDALLGEETPLPPEAAELPTQGRPTRPARGGGSSELPLPDSLRGLLC